MNSSNLSAAGLALIGSALLASQSPAAAQPFPVDPNQGTGVRVEQQGEGAVSTTQPLPAVASITLASRNQAASVTKPDPRRRIESRIQNRIESRLDTRIDRSDVTEEITPPRPSGRPRG